MATAPELQRRNSPRQPIQHRLQHQSNRSSSPKTHSKRPKTSINTAIGDLAHQKENTNATSWSNGCHRKHWKMLQTLRKNAHTHQKRSGESLRRLCARRMRGDGTTEWINWCGIHENSWSNGVLVAFVSCCGGNTTCSTWQQKLFPASHSPALSDPARRGPGR